MSWWSNPSTRGLDSSSLEKWPGPSRLVELSMGLCVDSVCGPIDSTFIKSSSFLAAPTILSISTRVASIPRRMTTSFLLGGVSLKKKQIKNVEDGVNRSPPGQ